MKLSDISNNPVDSLDYMERFVNDGSPSGFTYLNTTSKETHPRDGLLSFPLYECSPIMGSVETFGTIPISLSSDSTLIHPDMARKRKMIDNCILSMSKYRGIPTGSQRSVMIIDNVNAHHAYVKLHYDGIIGRVNRKITRNHALSALETSSLFYEAIHDVRIPSYFAFLPEVGCRILSFSENDSFYEFGTVFRLSKPCCTESINIKYIIPLFSLLSSDFLHPCDDPLLGQIIHSFSVDPYDYIVNSIIKHIIDCYFLLIIYYGLQPEWHGQNLLLGFDANFRSIYIIARDLDSVDRDLSIMKALNRRFTFESYPYKCLENEQYNYRIKHSFMFDHKIGEYIISPLIDYLCSEFHYSKDKMTQDIKSHVRGYVNLLPDDFFPSNQLWYKFDNVIVDQDCSSRPYVEKHYPLFR